MMPIVIAEDVRASSPAFATVHPPEEVLGSGEAISSVVEQPSLIEPTMFSNEPQNDAFELRDRLSPPPVIDGYMATDVPPELTLEERTLEPIRSLEDLWMKYCPWIVPWRATMVTTWTPGSGDQLGMTEIDLRETVIFPRVPGLVVTTGKTFHFLNGPVSTDLPDDVISLWADVMWMHQFNDHLKLQLAVAPGIYSDYQNFDHDAFRVMGRAIVTWQQSDEWEWTAGAVYLDRADILALPVLGAVYKPTDDWRIEMVFPKPRVARRITHDGERSSWVYISGELAGGSWAIKRADGRNDLYTYSALRAFIGYEAIRPRGFAPVVDLGYTFDRKVEYKSDDGNYSPPGGLLLRVGLSF